MKLLTTLVIASSLAIGGTALADDALVTKNKCNTCHAKDKKLVGPAFQEIAKKYKGNSAASAQLVKKVSDGGSGVWGPIPMPPHKGKVAEPDLKVMVDNILAQ